MLYKLCNKLMTLTSSHNTIVKSDDRFYPKNQFKLGYFYRVVIYNFTCVHKE